MKKRLISCALFFLFLFAGFFALSHDVSAGGAGSFLPPNVDYNPTYIASKGVSGANAAGSQLYTVQLNETLAYAWNRWTIRSLSPDCFSSGNNNFSSDIATPTCTPGWAAAAATTTLTVGYDATVTDVLTGSVLHSGDTLHVGQVVKFTFAPLTSQNIYWFNTGYSLDSPYGEWSANAAPPDRDSSGNVTCNAKDYTSTVTPEHITLDVYNDIVLNPPVKAVQGISGFTACTPLTADSMTCTVAAAAPSAGATFDFGATYGKFYYRYYDSRDFTYQPSPKGDGTYVSYGGSGCYGNNIPLRQVTSGSIYSDSGLSYNDVANSDYIINIPEQTIPYAFNVSGTTDTAPTTPTLTCGARTRVNQTTSFAFTATDPDGDALRYGIDWVGAGSINEWTPATGYVSSGTTQTASHTWSQPGTYTIKALTQDNKGASSAWAQPCTITVDPALPTALLTASNSQGITNPDGSTTVNPGDKANLRWSCTNSATAKIGIKGQSSTDQSVSPASGSTKQTDYGLIQTTTFELTCTNSDGIATVNDATVYVGNQSACTVTLSANPSTISSGGTSALTWTSENASAVTINNGVGGVTPVSEGSVNVSPTTSTDYTASCTGGGQPGTSPPATVTVGAPSNVSGLLTTDKSSVVRGSPVKLTWTSQNATSCSGTNFSTGGTTSGNTTVTLLSTTQYTLTCSDNLGNHGYDSQTVNVTEPDISIIGTPQFVRKGETTTITWSTTGTVDSCLVTGPGISAANSTLPSGSQQVVINNESTYTISCTAGQYNPIASTLVKLPPSFYEH